MSILPLILALAFHPVQDKPFTPTADYRNQTIHGFTILIHPNVLQHAEDAARLKRELETQFNTITRVMPDHALTALRQVRIWVEWDKRPDKAAEFHPSAIWLKAHGYNPEKAGCVEISNAKLFVKWSHSPQPCIALHELAHAFHHRVLGEQHPGIRAAFQQAIDRKLYDSVNYSLGGKRKAYAVTNAKEYFAELTEAYFGKNDFYPYTRAELQSHDPVGFRLMQETWEKSTSK